MNVNELSTLPILSWIDVARRLSAVPMRGTANESLQYNPPLGLVSSEVFWTGLTLTLESPDNLEDVNQWLRSIFGTWLIFNEKVPSIRLDGPSARPVLRVTYEFSGTRKSKSVFRPSASLEGNRPYAIDYPIRDSTSPPIIAFHSVKGGVGRTTAAMAFTQNMISTLSTTSGTVLFVDADFEAPGASYLYRTRKPEVSISLEDLMAIAHADTSEDLSSTIDFVAAQMLDQRIGDVFVLPVKRLLDDLTGFTIRPEHLVNARRNQPYLIVDLIRKLAEKLGCKLAVVDLRAGLVDIAIQFLTDPTVERVFVSTASGQSINALKGMLHTIGQIEKQAGEAGRQPFVLINQIPRLQYDDPVFRGKLQAQLEMQAEKSLLVPLASDDQGEFTVTPARESSLVFGFHFHSSDLVASADDWEAYLSDLKKTGFSTSLKSEMESWIDGRRIVAPNIPARADLKISAGDHANACSMLAQFANEFEFAETATSVKHPLITPPLQRLLGDFIQHPPIAVVEGTKGTGKTLTFRYLLEHKNWSSAATALGGAPAVAFEGLLLPILGSLNSSGGMQTLVAEGRAQVATRLGKSSPVPFSATTTNIREGIESKLDVTRWTNFWLTSIAQAAGFDKWEPFVEAVRTSGVTRPIAMFEGLEEVFTNPYTEVVQADALRALLREVPIRLREEAGRPIGVLIFARSDMVEAVIEQNVQQFRASYRSYALTWLDIDIQELAVWLVGNSGAIPNLWSSDWRLRSESQREADLQQIWGMKLGSDSSREARSTEWVLSVLTDLTGRLTARDLVRFMNKAALGAREQPMDDRLLTPSSMRKAVEYTSKQKVDEYPKEVRELLPIFEKLKSRQNLTTPFDRTEAAANGIEAKELDILEKYGVAYAEDGSFEIPELFRIGLNMKRKGARPNIISLTRKARERARA
ncbi:KGGVGR-motif variant AAA ATPase [Pseudomonas aeruginosa]|uniref:KGGVGR-motif variant AAA ATPase n=1 Tax=Pseudomonas aeruginosa TaxID=287 RepID=UPI001ABE77EB|nr:hypothetical protein [Pseudomonas aeruginosa]MBO3780395.1 hypothetical protein [Pseudomonas aeruginosa]MDP5658047.1 hypothetical protein [Pseudomonas aeruginosa]HBO0245212.1 hypothetical protein [Pseudomonas aeruginosa]HBP1524237.1 ParA family protein [Pseudomonas aeruginosa]HCF4674995.1 hypothetical protein [Pseudomonas aeruginosa]